MLVADAVRAVIQDPRPPLVLRTDRRAKALPVVRALVPQRLGDALFAAYRRVSGGARGRD